MGLKFMILRSRVECCSNWASQVPPRFIFRKRKTHLEPERFFSPCISYFAGSKAITLSRLPRTQLTTENNDSDWRTLYSMTASWKVSCPTYATECLWVMFTMSLCCTCPLVKSGGHHFPYQNIIERGSERLFSWPGNEERDMDRLGNKWEYIWYCFCGRQICRIS